MSKGQDQGYLMYWGNGGEGGGRFRNLAGGDFVSSDLQSNENLCTIPVIYLVCPTCKAL